MEHWNFALADSTTLRPGIRTFKPRRSRITRREQRALDNPGPLLLILQESTFDFFALFEVTTPPVLEIGFGIGDATLAYAQSQPDIPILAIDVHTPGVGRVIADLQQAHITNVRVMEADAITVLEQNVPDQSLSGVRSFFPDPWPKARHFKRRLVQPAVLHLVARKLIPGGWWHIATDWPEYAEWIESTFSIHPEFTGGAIDRPHDRPVTHFEQRGINEGRPSVDFRYTKSK